MVSDVKYLFMCLFLIYISTLVKCMLMSCFFFLISLFGFFTVVLRILQLFFMQIVNMVRKYFLPVCSQSFHPLHKIYYSVRNRKHSCIHLWMNLKGNMLNEKKKTCLHLHFNLHMAFSSSHLLFSLIRTPVIQSSP